MSNIHPTAIIHPEAELADDVVVGPYSIVGAGVRIGSGTRLAGHVLVEGHTTLGERNQVFHGAAIGSAPQDYSYTGAESYLDIGDDNIIREYVTMQPGSEKGGRTSIGNQNLLMAYVHVAHNCHIGNRTILANAVNLAGFVRVEDWVVIGGVTPVHQFVRIGRHAIVGGGSRIPQDVAPFTKVAGNPPKTYGLNSIGLSRRGFEPAAVSALKDAYRIYFRQKLTASEACERIAAEAPDVSEVRQFLDFVREPGRGIIR